MDDAAFEKQCARVRALVDKWPDMLGLRHWTLAFKYCREPFDAPQPDGRTTAADCVADWRYMSASIRFDMGVVEGLDDEELEETFVHEMMHVFLNEMRTKGIDHEERVATMLANAVRFVKQEYSPKPILVEAP